MKVSKYLLVLLFAVSLGSCHRTKTVAKTETQLPTPTPSQTPVVMVPVIDANVQSLLKSLNKNELQFKEVAAKLKTKVTSPDLNQSFTTNIRWKKGEKIWLSMSIIGIEGARVLITKDSIKIMDKLNNRYILKPLSYIKQKTLVDLTFADIENLLLGQLIFTDSTIAKYANNATK